jgi:uncharacterized protein (TIGR03067 family)
MKMHALLVVAVTGLLVAAQEARKGGPLNEGKDDLTGTWTVVSAEADGQEDENTQGATVTFTAGKMTLKAKNGDHEAICKVRPDKNPKEMDWTPSDGERAGKLHKAIYEIRDGKLTILMAQPDQPRPRDFKNMIRVVSQM